MNETFKKRLPSLAVTSLMAGTASLGIMAAEPALAAMDAFLEIPGIPGESQDDKHKGDIDVISYAHNFVQAERGRTTRGACSEVQVVKHVDRATPALALRAVTGQPIPTMTLTLRMAGEKPLEFYKVTMQEVTVVNSQVNAAGSDDRGRETVHFSIGSGTIEYRPRNPDGTGGAPVTEAISCAPVGRAR